MSRSPALTATYVALAAAALVLCWSNNIEFFGARRAAAEKAGKAYSMAADFGEGFAAFFLEAFNNKTSACIITELLAAVGAFAVQFKSDGARFGVLLPFLWLQLSYLVAISVTVPLFFAASHGARARRSSSRSELPAAAFPFATTLAFLCLTTVASVAQYYVATGPVGGDPLAIFQKLMAAAFVLTLPYLLSPLSIGSSRPHSLSPPSVPRVQFLFGLCAGISVVLLTVARLPLIAQALSDTTSLQPFALGLYRDAFALPAIRSITWDYLLLLASFVVHVLAEGPFSLPARLAWALFAVAFFPVAVPMYLMSELARDPAKVKTA